MRTSNKDIIDATMIGVAERLLKFAREVEEGKSPDLGAVITLHIVARSLVMATQHSNSDTLQ
jgi:hypothetical protein